MEENNVMTLADAVSKAAWCHNTNITDSRPTSGKYLFDKASGKKLMQNTVSDLKEKLVEK